MMKKLTRQISPVISAIVLSLALIGCSNSDEEAPAEAQGADVVESVVKAVKPEGPSNALLSYVPDDTVFFFGTAEPVPDSEYLAFLKPGVIQAGSANAALDDMKTESDGAKMLMAFYKRYLNAIESDPAGLSAAFGIANEWNSALYTVNAVPVMRVALEEQATFDRILDEVQTEQQITPTEVKNDGVRIRRYEFTDAKDNSQRVDLVIATNEQDAVFSIHIESLGEPQLNATLGITKPATSIVESGTLRGVVNDNGFVSTLVGYIDHQHAVKMATSPDSVPFLAALQAMDKSAESQNSSHPLKDPQCQTEFADIATRWPRTVFGYTKWDTQSEPMLVDGVIRVETSNTEFLDQLKSIQGKLHLPQALADEVAVMTFGLGVDIDALLPFLSWYGESMEAVGWQCEPLQKMTESLASANSASVTMAGTMLSGIKGATLAVLDAKVTGDKQQPFETLDAMIAVNTSNPTVLVTMLKASPFLGGAQIATDGTPTPITLPFPGLGNVQPMLVVKDSALALFAGPRSGAVVDTLDQSAPVDSFVSVNIDYGKYMGLVMQGMEKFDTDSQNIPEDQRKAFEALKNMKMTSGMTVEVGKGAIEFGTTMEVPR